VWPFDASIGPLPEDVATALNPDGPWGQAARGVEVRDCSDPARGMGVFARRRLLAGDLVGLYWGEKLTRREYISRHGGERDSTGALINRSVDGRSGVRGSLSAIIERATAVERRERLDALTYGKPVGEGSYVFLLPQSSHCLVRGEPVYCIDAEDPNRSSWCRFMNHARSGSPASNVDQQISREGDIWFVTNSVVEAGTELCFDYGPNTMFGSKSPAAGT